MCEEKRFIYVVTSLLFVTLQTRIKSQVRHLAEARCLGTLTYYIRQKKHVTGKRGQSTMARPRLKPRATATKRHTRAHLTTGIKCNNYLRWLVACLCVHSLLREDHEQVQRTEKTRVNRGRRRKCIKGRYAANETYVRIIILKWV